MSLASKDGVARDKVIEFAERGRLLPVALTQELQVLCAWLKRYADTLMDFADACVARLAVEHGIWVAVLPEKLG